MPRLRSLLFKINCIHIGSCKPNFVSLSLLKAEIYKFKQTEIIKTIEFQMLSSNLDTVCALPCLLLPVTNICNKLIYPFFFGNIFTSFERVFERNFAIEIMLSPIVCHAPPLPIFLRQFACQSYPSCVAPSHTHTHMAYAACAGCVWLALTRQATLLIRSVGHSLCGDKSRWHSIQFDSSA